MCVRMFVHKLCSIKPHGYAAIAGTRCPFVWASSEICYGGWCCRWNNDVLVQNGYCRTTVSICMAVSSCSWSNRVVHFWSAEGDFRRNTWCRHQNNIVVAKQHSNVEHRTRSRLSGYVYGENYSSLVSACLLKTNFYVSVIRKRGMAQLKIDAWPHVSVWLWMLWTRFDVPSHEIKNILVMNLGWPSLIDFGTLDWLCYGWRVKFYLQFDLLVDFV